MLAPDDRNLFLNALRPPEGYTFDNGIGTTFTLDLFTLLIAPLALALFDRQSTEQALSDPLALLESLRKYAVRLTIFCQAGRISLPAKPNPLFSFLEDMIVEVQAPRGGVFHAKLWLLRFIADGKPPMYRLLNLSRNLTFDRSWDLLLSLEGEVSDRKLGYSLNRPLGDFLQILPDLALHKITQKKTERNTQIYDEVRRVNFITPAGFDRLVGFHPFGIPGYKTYHFEPPADRYLVISPFLTAGLLNRITSNGNHHTLISRLESLDELPVDIYALFEQVYLLDEMAENDPRETVQGIDEKTEPDSNPIEPPASELSGLHAKLFIWEKGQRADWLIGSANATEAAFRNNVEFMVQLSGNKHYVGIESVMGEGENRNSLHSLLHPYVAPDQKPSTNRNLKRAEELVNQLRLSLANSEYYVCIEHTGDRYDMLLEQGKQMQLPAGDYSVACWPVSIPDTYRKELIVTQVMDPLRFEGISLVGITSFFAFEVAVRIGKEKHKAQFVLNLPIKDLPEERDGAVLCSILSDRSQFFRYLRLLLMEDIDIASSGGWSLGRQNYDNSEFMWNDTEMPLLEELVRALSRSNDPNGKIDRITSLVERMLTTPEGLKIIPPEFDALWQKVLQARKDLR
jgi:hypothetical protein